MAAAAGPSDLQGASRNRLSGSGDAGSRLSRTRPRARASGVGSRIPTSDRATPTGSSGGTGYGLQPIRARVRPGRRQHHHLLEVGEGSDARDDRDPSRELGRGGGEKRERSSDRDTEETDPPVAGLGRVGRRHRTLDGGRERRERELAGCDARKLRDEDDVSGSCERGREAAHAGVSPAVGCRAVHEHHRRPGRSRPRAHRHHRPGAEGPLPEVRGRAPGSLAFPGESSMRSENSGGSRLDAEPPQRSSGARGETRRRRPEAKMIDPLTPMVKCAAVMRAGARRTRWSRTGRPPRR